MKSSFDKILTSAPVNALANVVTSKGYQYTPSKKVLTADTDLPLKTRRQKKGLPDFTGKKFGQFTVIGLSENVKKRWVVRCDCGTYTLRTAKSISNPSNDKDCCEHCRHLRHLKRSDYFYRYGRDKD